MLNYLIQATNQEHNDELANAAFVNTLKQSEQDLITRAEPEEWEAIVIAEKILSEISRRLCRKNL